MRTIILKMLAVALFAPMVVVAQPPAKGIYVAVADDHGAPVKGLTVGDFSLQVDGKTRAPVSVVPATEPMSIAVVMDSLSSQANNSRAQTAMGSVIAMMRQRAPAGSRIGFSGVARSAEAGTPDFAAQRGMPVGSILERIMDAATALRSEPNRHRVIFVVSTDALEVRLTPRTVIDALHDAHAALWNVDISSPKAGVSDNGVSNSIEERGLQDHILDAAVKASGGWRQTIFDAAGLEGPATHMVDLLCAGYAIDPGPLSATETVRISETRHGLKIFAPTWDSGK